MEAPAKFELAQARELAEAMAGESADYLFLGKAGAILLGYPGTTQDLDLFAPRDAANAGRCIRALERIGFNLDEETRNALLRGKDFVQIKDGPFDVDIIHAPDGIDSFAAARSRRVMESIYPVASLRDIIASKKAANRRKDLADIDLLEEFAEEFERRRSQPLRTALERALERGGDEPVQPKHPPE